MRCGVFPSSYQLVTVMPILKTGDATPVENNRPISTLKLFSIIFEKSVQIRLVSFLLRFLMLSANQLDFS